MKSDALINAVWPGQAYPRGATWDGEGVNFSLFSANAEKVELCLFDPSGRHEVQRINVRERTDESGTSTCRKRGPASCTATASMDPTIRKTASASIRTSC